MLNTKHVIKLQSVGGGRWALKCTCKLFAASYPTRYLSNSADQRKGSAGQRKGNENSGEHGPLYHHRTATARRLHTLALVSEKYTCIKRFPKSHGNTCAGTLVFCGLRTGYFIHFIQ